MWRIFQNVQYLWRHGGTDGFPENFLNTIASFENMRLIQWIFLFFFFNLLLKLFSWSFEIYKMHRRTRNSFFVVVLLKYSRWYLFNIPYINRYRVKSFMRDEIKIKINIDGLPTLFLRVRSAILLMYLL